MLASGLARDAFVTKIGQNEEQEIKNNFLFHHFTDQIQSGE